VREKERVEKAAERQRQKDERDRAKALQLSQKRKRKASRVSLLSNKRQKRSGGGAATAAPVEELSARLPKITSRGRNVNLPKKFR
jgi:hypothetical protein